MPPSIGHGRSVAFLNYSFLQLIIALIGKRGTPPSGICHCLCAAVMYCFMEKDLIHGPSIIPRRYILILKIFTPIPAFTLWAQEPVTAKE